MLISSSGTEVLVDQLFMHIEKDTDIKLEDCDELTCHIREKSQTQQVRELSI